MKRILRELVDVMGVAAAAMSPLLALAMTDTPSRDWRWIVIAIWFMLTQSKSLGGKTERPASNELDARVIAFALDGGLGEIQDFGQQDRTIEDGEIELAKTYTECIGVVVTPAEDFGGLLG